ncbi:Riboflavin biosynthesis protein RibF [Paraliobacillus sp. PM-2]|uniref:riboflavin kinase n=1 Tax=Paraliobacillus sp. PM-2 TaxID=1462524 RepID=UPI00061C3190|nr:riboflavin kinase [Paraliobacillus sp. PM-2]CQR47126.1 Riboflavin biosynthesis protein RibF [Paraliobacillus sp. PM-2]
MESIGISKQSQMDRTPFTLVLGCFDIFHRGKQHVLQTAKRSLKDTEEKVAVIDLNFFLKGKKVTSDKLLFQLLEQYHVSKYTQLRPQEGKTLEDLITDLFSQLIIHRIVIDQALLDNNVLSSQLINKFRQMGIQVEVVSGVKVNEDTVTDDMVSSSIVNGHVEQAQALLGQPYTIIGKVVHGEKMGRKLGFPTLNLGEVDHYVMPKPGVYFGIVGIHKEDVITEYYNVLISAGYRPAVNGDGYLIEAHILNYTGDLYENTVSVSFLHFMREEKDFSDLDALIMQMKQDKKIAEKLISVQNG